MGTLDFLGRKKASGEKKSHTPVVVDSSTETPVEISDEGIYNLEEPTAKCDDTSVEVLTVGGDDMPHTGKKEVVYEEKLVCENEAVLQQTDKIIDETARIINALRQSINNQETIYGMLESEMQRQVEENRRLSEIIKKQHETISRFQKDMLYYSQKDVLFEIIKIADEVETIKEIGLNGGDLQEQVNGLSEFIDSGLTFSAVKSFMDADGVSKEYNPRRQELTQERIVTHDPKKAGAIVSLRRGYIWRLPWLVANTDVQLGNFIKANKENQTYEVLIRPEKVARMVYEAANEEVATNDKKMDDYGVNF